MMKLVILIAVFLLASCVDSSSSGEFITSREVNVVSREGGSGTRGAFVEILGIFHDGHDWTTLEADVANGTSVVIQSVAGNSYAIGYITIGSLNPTVKALDVNGVSPNPENIRNGTYPLFRPFYMSVRQDVDALTQDFIDFILSQEGSYIIESRGYVPINSNAPVFTGGNLSGTIVVSGSTAVTPIMDRLAEAYELLNPDVTVEVHTGGSSAGITGSIDGINDIGMSSRPLTAAELANLTAIPFAMDGLAVIVNPNNPLSDISPEQVRQVFMGDIIRWYELYEYQF